MDNTEAPLKIMLDKFSEADGEPSRDDLLNSFLEHVSNLEIELYPAQEEAILELLDWKHVILNTPTGSGKSLVAMAMHFQAMAEGRISYYTCPIKALVNEKFFDLCDLFGPENVGLMTGDAAVNRDAPIICCTAEILSNMALRQDDVKVDYVVMDEFHFYGDKDRGAAWQIPLITMSDTLFLLMSATLGDTEHIEKQLKDFTDRDIAVIAHALRPVPLEYEYRETPLQETVQELLDADEAPIYLVNFTQRSCGEQAQALTSVNVCSKDDKREIALRLNEVRFDSPYGRELRRFLKVGIGVHHAGLLPKYRLLVEKLAQAGLLKVISGTDSLGVGVNIPIRTVVFRAMSKFDGEKTRLLSARQFHQISGRAGRRGFDDHGRVVVQAPEHIIENKKIEAKLVKNPHLKKKLKKRKPPTWGFIPWDKEVFNKLVHSPPEPLVPQFQVNHGMLMSALQSDTERRGGGYRRLVEIIGRSHSPVSVRRGQLKHAASLFRSLVSAEIIDVIHNDDSMGAHVRIREGLQENFSLNQALSLFLVEAIDLLDPEHDDYALDVLTLVESVLENPKVILFRQVDRIKDELIGRLKAEGVPYDERMEKLEKVEHYKPNQEAVYEAFNAFAEHHPWVGNDNIQPKSIAREMYEKMYGFNEYILHLQAARSEGVLLRYLSQAYKTALQNVPEEAWDERFEDIHYFMLTLLRRTDSSLIDEWERMMHGEVVVPKGRHGDEEDKKPIDVSADPKAFAARIRNELYLLLKALSRRNWEDACSNVRQLAPFEWTEERFAAEMAPFWEEHSDIDVTPRSRQPRNTVIRAAGSKVWEIQHKIIDPEGDDDWALDCVIDLNTPLGDGGEPLIQLRRIGV